MADESLRKRLEVLNRGPLPAPLTAPPKMRKAQRKCDPAPAIVAPRAMKPLPGLLRQSEVVENDVGQHARIRLSVEDLWQCGPQLVAARHEQLSLDRAKLVGELAWIVEAFPERTLILDVETCGLAGAALFLIGVIRSIDGQLVVELLLARNYAEERAVLQSFWQISAVCDVIITFNGKTFDWPMVLDRSRRHLLFRGTQPRQPRHIDVLHHARRRWRRQMPNFRLQTLEQHVCKRRRIGDIPGHMIPAAYADYVRTGFERDIEAILYHNAVDLITLLDLTMRLPS